MRARPLVVGLIVALVAVLFAGCGAPVKLGAKFCATCGRPL